MAFSVVLIVKSIFNDEETEVLAPKHHLDKRLRRIYTREGLFLSQRFR